MAAAIKMPTEEELELMQYNEVMEHLERMDGYDSLGKAVTAELGRLNLIQIVDVAQSFMPDKLKLDTESVNHMSNLLKRMYKELNGEADIVKESDPKAEPEVVEK